MQTSRTSSGARAIGALLLVAAAAILGLGPAPAGAAPVTNGTEAVRPICFPVVEPVRYVDSFGAPRSGHRHQGADLLGGKGFHLVAPADAVIVDLRGPGEGYSDYSLRMVDGHGWYYAFLHMNDDTPGTDDGSASFDMVFAPGLAEGVAVRAGQFLGYMGDSGNAEGSTAHLHFEIRQPNANLWNAAAVNPFPSLQIARHCPDPLAAPRYPPGRRVSGLPTPL
jgi:murein DD-endopeptidase MepM/ murein hydrolase activator NlpD